MSVIQKLFDAQNNQDIKAYNEAVSEDYVWVKHSQLILLIKKNLKDF